METSKVRLGYILVLIASVLLGLSTAINKLVLDRGVHPFLVNFSTYFILACTLLPLAYTKKSRGNEENGDVKDKSRNKRTYSNFKITLVIVASGILGIGTAGAFFFYGLSRTTAVNASLLINTEVLFSVIIAYIFLKERGKAKDYLAIILLLVCAIVVTTNLEFSTLSLAEKFIGNVFIIITCLIWGVDNNVSKIIVSRYSVIKMTTVKMLFASFSVIVIGALIGMNFNIDLVSFVYIIFNGAFSMAVGFLFYYIGLKNIGSMRTNAVYSTQAIFGLVFAYLILNESLSLLQISTGALMMIGVYILSKDFKKVADA
jgi:drug/metabolite transporter (DMT)-like permease